MKSWENVLVSGVRTQVTSHHLKTWKREHWAQFYCRNVETEITLKPSWCKNVRVSLIFLCWSLWFYDLIMAGSQFYAEEWWNRVEECKNWSNQLPLDATFPTIIKKSAKSLPLYPVNLMHIFALNLLSKVHDFLHDICWHCTLTTMLQLETNITVALSVAWLETRVMDLK